jgi:hypothetical protein
MVALFVCLVFFFVVPFENKRQSFPVYTRTQLLRSSRNQLPSTVSLAFLVCYLLLPVVWLVNLFVIHQSITME